MKIPLFGLALLAAGSAGLAQPDKNDSALQRIAKPNRSGTAWSVRVPDGPLVWTGLVFGADNSGDARTQADSALAALRVTLAAAGADLPGVVRLNAYVGSDAGVAAVEAVVAARFASTPVAFSIVRTPLARVGAVVAFEAVAMTTRPARSVEVVSPLATVMPAGGKLFISGQAAREGTDLVSRVKLTMAGLQRTLTHYGLTKADVVQVKAFIQPFAQHAIAEREIAASFEGGPVPATVLLEWVSDLHTEIELVAWAPKLPAPAGDNIAYSWLPWLTTSPRFSRAAQVPAGTPLIFIGGLDGGEGDPRAQMKTIFERLGSVLFEAGSSYRNLAKATYYLADPRTRALLGDIRGVYFDPARPPAASALDVTSLGHPGRAAVIDMIAVPVK